MLFQDSFKIFSFPFLSCSLNMICLHVSFMVVFCLMLSVLPETGLLSAINFEVVKYCCITYSFCSVLFLLSVLQLAKLAKCHIFEIVPQFSNILFCLFILFFTLCIPVWRVFIGLSIIILIFSLAMLSPLTSFSKTFFSAAVFLHFWHFLLIFS